MEMNISEEQAFRLYPLMKEKEELEKAEEQINKIVERKNQGLPTIDSYGLCGLYIRAGDYDNAFVWLNRAYEERISQVFLTKYWPDLEPIRSDPRFKALLRKMGLPED